MQKIQSYKLENLTKRIEATKKHDVPYGEIGQTIASLPEPLPKPQGRIVPDHLLSVIEQAQELQLDPTFDRMRNDHLQKLSELVKQRNAFGMQKYGQPLYSEDGRNGLEDARQELGDLLQYVCKVQMSSENYTVEELEEFLSLFNTAVVLIRYFIKMARLAETKL